ncbi:helix-turn-helix domain-containing protein [Streptomyces sp. NPDC047123]|uniref:helix-turn-helix domain-containing protein n=1 Tax=Streptomyces sp. NPDC047123 TaxID=3155622 RepID=UPI0033C69F24
MCDHPGWLSDRGGRLPRAAAGPPPPGPPRGGECRTSPLPERAPGTATDGQLLQRRRKEAGLSLPRMAELAHYDKGYLSKVENGRKPMSVELAQACDQVLGTGGELVERAQSAAAKARGGDRPPLAQLPAAPRGVFGRSDASLRLEGLLAGRADMPGRVPMVCVDGLPGVGKTTLVLRCAHAVAGRFADGALFVNLRGEDRVDGALDSGQVLGGFLRALGVQPGRIPDDRQERAAMYRSLLSGRSVLVVLDDAATSAQVEPLLPGSDGCAVLVTSRRHLAGLQISPAPAMRLTLGPLAPPDATDLLRSVIGGHRADVEPAALARVALRCGYLPLALRTAAVWIAAHPRLSIAEFDRHLEADSDFLDLLGTGADDLHVIVRGMREPTWHAGFHPRRADCLGCR